MSGTIARLRIATLVAVTAAATLAWWACGPGDLSDLTRGAGRDAGADVAVESAVPACEVVGIPDPPTMDDDGDTPIIFAVRQLRVDTGSRDAGLAAARGLNLDRTCGCACTGPTETCGSADTPFDNQTGKLLAEAAALIVFDPVKLDDAIRRGGFSLLIGVGGWNGQPDDPLVAVQVWLSTGTPSDDAGVTAIPRFDGTDVWNVDRDSIVLATAPGAPCNEAAACLSKYTDKAAYVSQGRLVAKIDPIPLAFVIEQTRLAVDLSGGILVASLTKTDAGEPSIAGELSGRMPAEAFLASAARFNVPALNEPVCKVAGVLEQLQGAVCPARDVLSDPKQDHTGAKCNGLSSAASFTGSVAKLGVVSSRPASTVDCPDASYACP